MNPLIVRLKLEAHRKIAAAQDIIIEELYKVFDGAVLHGGTAIWRCYQGKRFSEDIDAYIPKNEEKISTLFQNLTGRGFFIEKKKVGDNSLYSSLRLDRTLVRFEALFKKEKGVVRDYETVQGTFASVYTLTPEAFVEEKVPTYLKRLKIRDLYDLFFLLRLVQDIRPVLPCLKKLLQQFKPPLDEKEMKNLILEGIAPSWRHMLEYIQDKVKREG